MNLIKAVASLNRTHHWWQKGQPVVVAVSTGVDSMTLLNVLQHLDTQRPQIIVAYVNHHLRAVSDREERFLKAYCRNHHLTLRTADWRHHPDQGIENAAREFRYRFFAQVLKHYSATVLITAHHQNDQAETMLMRLISGGPLRELTGIKVRRPFGDGNLIRPLLWFDKPTLLRFAQTHHLKWFEDETNQHNDVFRNRIRNRLLPLMKAEDPKVVAHLNDYIQQLQTTLTVNQQLLEPILKQVQLSSTILNLGQLKSYSSVVKMEVIRMWIKHFRTEIVVNSAILKELEQLINNSDKPNGVIMLNHRYQIIKQYSRLLIKKVNHGHQEHAVNDHFMVRLNHWYSLLNGKQFGVWTKADHFTKGAKAPLVLTAEQLPLCIRKWQRGDQLTLKNDHHQKVRRILINQKVPINLRDQAQVLVDSKQQLLSLIGYKNSYQRINSQIKYWLILK